MKISETLLNKIEAEALDAYPREACGFLTGVPSGDEILDATASENISTGRHEFILDAALHLKLQRSLRVIGQAVIGIYHSHPSGDSHPSKQDISSISDQNLLWMIIGVGPDQSPKTRIFSPKTGKNGSKSQSFDENPLQKSGFVA